MNDFEFRVWDTYRWAADDFGVLPMSPAKLRGENDALANQHTDDEVGLALQRLIDVQLITEFEHQGARYVCSLTWQSHQKITHPRQTHLPCPPAQVVALMDVTTRKFFRSNHPSFCPSRARATRETANGKRQTANGSGEGGGLQRSTPSRGLQRSGELLERFERFWGEYPHKVNKSAALKEWLKLAPTDEQTNHLIASVQQQRASAQWRKDGGEYVPHARTWLHQRRWDDDLRPPRTDGARALPSPSAWRHECADLAHQPPCSTSSHHEIRKAIAGDGCTHPGVCQTKAEHQRRLDKVAV